MSGRSRARAGMLTRALSGLLRAVGHTAPALLLAVPAHTVLAVQRTNLDEVIPAQPLARALEAFARQTGLHLVYLSDVVRGRRSQRVEAGINASEALNRLLEGSGLDFDYLSAHSVQIVARSARHEGNPRRPEEPDLQAIIVTANRREEDLQDVPISLQVLTGATLARLNATNFDDFVSYLPGVTSRGVGPAQSNIYIRGLGTSLGGIQSSGYNALFPNVAVYLDEQGVQLPYRNLDLYLADIERIEVLEGPQGTLFGAGAEAGVVRYITRKPQLDVTESAANAGYAVTAHGQPTTSVDAMLNVPLIEGSLAVRGVIYQERRGGYLTNHPATFARNPYSYIYDLPVVAPVINNDALAGPAINPVSYQGLRIEILAAFNPDWNLLLAQSYQNMEADGVFAEMQQSSLGEPQPDLSAQLFNKATDKDRFENTALALTGRVGALQVLYTGSYLVRRIDQVADYTNYARGLYSDYYQCAPPAAGAVTLQCFSPSATWHEQERNTHLSHELRVSSPGDGRARVVGGLFYEKYRVQDQMDWYYLTAASYFNPIGPPSGATSANPNVRPPGDAFLDDVTRDYAQRAAYASVDYDLLPDKLTLTLGSRYFRFDNAAQGSTVSSIGCLKPYAPDPCVNVVDPFNFNLDKEHLRRTYRGFRSRATLSLRPVSTALLYYTWSQGYRAGGFNRGSVEPTAGSPLDQGSAPSQVQARQHRGWSSPAAFAPDQLINNEIGLKSRWLSGRLQWDTALYQEMWKNAQLSLFPSNLTGTSGFNMNGGDYRVRGIESFVVASLFGGLSLQAGGTLSRSRLVREGTFYWVDGQPIDFSSLRVGGEPVPNPAGRLGSPLAGAPGFAADVRLGYDWTFDRYRGMAQLAAVHQSHARASTQEGATIVGNDTNYQLSPFTSYDAMCGVGSGPWTVQLYGENLADTRAQLFATYAQYYRGVTVSRPRTIGVRIRFSSH